MAMMCAACTSGSDEPASPRPAPAEARSISFQSLDLDWPKSQGKLDPPELPAAPRGFDDTTLERMATVLEKWARLSTVDEGMWHSDAPFSDIRTVLPKDAADTYEQQIKGQVSPHLAVANVFRHDVTVVGSPMVTSAWRVSTEKDPANEPFMRLELQTRAAYEVRLGGGTRVIGVLRVHSLSAYKDTTDDFGVGGGWQEFGAGDCALAIDDALVPDSDRSEALEDLKTFVRVGDGTKLEMPELPAQDQVDAEYLKRCRDGQV
jgi:hypothetical protein